MNEERIYLVGGNVCGLCAGGPIHKSFKTKAEKLLSDLLDQHVLLMDLV